MPPPAPRWSPRPGCAGRDPCVQRARSAAGAGVREAAELNPFSRRDAPGPAPPPLASPPSSLGGCSRNVAHCRRPLALVTTVGWDVAVVRRSGPCTSRCPRSGGALGDAGGASGAGGRLGRVSPWRSGPPMPFAAVWHCCPHLPQRRGGRDCGGLCRLTWDSRAPQSACRDSACGLENHALPSPGGPHSP